MTYALTPRQREILNYIVECVDTRDYPPTIKEICERVGLASSSTAHQHVQALRAKGFIAIGPGPRAITILERAS